MKIIKGSEVKRVLDSVPVTELLQRISKYPDMQEEISQINIDKPGSHRVVAHIGNFFERYYCKYAVSTPCEDERAKILLTISDNKGPIALINGTWLSHYRTALIGISKICELDGIPINHGQLPIRNAFILGRGPVGSSIAKFLLGLGVEIEIAGRNYKFKKMDALFVAITEDSEEPIWHKDFLHNYFKIICDYTRHSIAFTDNMDVVDKSKSTFIPSEKGDYFRITGSIAYDIALVSLILNKANYTEIDIN